MSEKDGDFKVIDRRGTRDESTKESSNPAKGDGFTMHDSSKQNATPTQLDFSTLVFSLATGSLIQMGVAPDPATKKTTKNLELARQNIEILAMLQEKTRGNLTQEETTLLESLLAEIRLRFVEASKK